MLWNKKRTKRRRRRPKGLIRTAGTLVLAHLMTLTPLAPNPVGWLASVILPQQRPATPQRTAASHRPPTPHRTVASRARPAPSQAAAAATLPPANPRRTRARSAGLNCLASTRAPRGAVPLRTRFRYEEAHLSPWLARNIQVLGAVTGQRLKVRRLEARVGRYEADIIARGRTGPVVVENQFGSSDHDHLGKLLTYMAGTGAREGIWVAERFSPEHVAALKALKAYRIHAVALHYVANRRGGPVVLARAIHTPPGRAGCAAVSVPARGVR